MTYTMTYTFGDLETLVTYSHDGYSNAADPGGITLESVRIGDTDILGALPLRIIDDIAYFASEELLAA